MNYSSTQITSSSIESPAPFPVWVHLRPFPNNSLDLLQYSGGDPPRLWLTGFMGFGSTGHVWTCQFDNNNELFAIKIVEQLRCFDAAACKRLCNEFQVYLSLEEAYISGKLPYRIAPHCYGAFESDIMDVLILEICDSIGMS